MDNEHAVSEALSATSNPTQGIEETGEKQNHEKPKRFNQKQQELLYSNFVGSSCLNHDLI